MFLVVIDDNRLVRGIASTVIDLTSHKILRKRCSTRTKNQDILKNQHYHKINTSFLY